MKNIMSLSAIVLVISLVYVILPVGSFLKAIIYMLPNCITFAIVLLFIKKILQD